MAQPYVEDVFKISGVPTHTFVEPHEFGHLKVALRSAGRGVVVEGPSGIGKTTAVARALEEIEFGGRVQPLSARKPEDIDYIQLLPELNGFGVIVIDDFHVLPIPVQNATADLLKTLADEDIADSKLVVVGINRAGDALIRHAPDLSNRIDVIKFEVEPKDKVEQVVRLGEQVLNIELCAGDQVVEAAGGSFYLAQMLCHELCVETGISDKQEQTATVRSSYSSVRSRVMDRQDRRFGADVREFARGTKFR
ncbi:MAG: ATP-binding protein, partial [Actinobacteria bacterium]|nr:ATP-binding protein [Actinomycetota bacterium]